MRTQRGDGSSLLRLLQARRARLAPSRRARLGLPLPAALAALASLAACESAAIGSRDAGVADASDVDAATTPDASSADTGELDAGATPDTATPDTDAAMPDGAQDAARDSGPADAGCRPETCNGLDDDCDGVADDGIPLVAFYRDEDGDLRGDPTMSREACAPPEGYVPTADDCDDADVGRATGLLEVCGDAKDNDCNGMSDDRCVAAPPEPVAIAPWNGYRSGSLHAGSRALRPLFRFRAVEGTIEHDIELSCTGERGCRFVTTTYRARAPAVTAGVSRWSPPDDLPVASAAPVGTRYRWRVRSCVGTVCSGFTPARYLDVGRANGDVNGDGYSEVAVGDDQADGTFDSEGAIALFFGSRSGIERPARWSQPAPDPVLGGRFGNALSLGDTNGDGFDDLAVGAYKLDWPENDEGNVYVFLGSATGLATPPIRIDSPSDQTTAMFGFSVHVADLDGDGYAELVAGAPYETVGSATDAGRLYVFEGGLSGPATTPTRSLDSTTPVADARFGYSSVACDLDADGYPDLLVAEDEYPGDSPAEGRVHHFPSSEAGLDEGRRDTIANPDAEPVATGGRFGQAACGDLDGDGYRDLVVGAWTATIATGPASGSVAGSVFIFPGARGGLGMWRRVDNPTPEDGAGFGRTVALGDVDADGLDDLLVGAHQQGTGDMDLRGDAFFFLVRPGFVLAPPHSLLPRAIPSAARFGRALTASADVDGDGDVDVVLGAPGARPGEAFVFEGDPRMPLGASTTLTPRSGGVAFGAALARLDRMAPLDARLFVRPLFDVANAAHPLSGAPLLSSLLVDGPFFGARLPAERRSASRL